MLGPASAALRAANFKTWLLLRLLLPGPGFVAFSLIYHYFRWADDRVDAPDRDPDTVRRFVVDQEGFQAGNRAAACPEEQALRAGLGLMPALNPAVTRMTEALRFDAFRGPELLAPEQLDAQVARIGDAWAHAMWACAGGGVAPEAVCATARGATLAHMIRDQAEDARLGYLNLPTESEALRSHAEAARRLLDRAGEVTGPRRARWLVRAMAWRYRRHARG